MNCPDCNQPISKNDRFCTRCGRPVNIPQQKAGNKNTTVVALIALSTCALSVAVIAVAVVMCFRISADSKKATDAYQSEAGTSASDVSPTEDVTDYSAPAEKTTVPTTKNTQPTTAGTTQKKEAHDPYWICEGGYFKVKYTPDGAGVVLRDGYSSSAEKISVLKEGSVVRALSDYSSLDNGYIYVYSEDAQSTGCVLASYLYPYNPYPTNITYKDFTGDMYARVCFSTPGHAGINMRAETNSSSERLCLLTEGNIIEILEPYSKDNNAYIYVGYNHPHAGEYYKGWVLADYLEYYGYRN